MCTCSRVNQWGPIIEYLQFPYERTVLVYRPTRRLDRRRRGEWGRGWVDRSVQTPTGGPGADTREDSVRARARARAHGRGAGVGGGGRSRRSSGAGGGSRVPSGRGERT